MMIEAKIIADSINLDYNSRLTTFELTYPRFILAELNTHRVFSRNSASSRAIPIDKVLELLKDNPAMPVHWGKNKGGMQADSEVDNIEGAKAVWLAARDAAISHAIVLRDMQVHKQVVNRLLEPWQMMKTVVSATCFKNFFWLRNHADAQPEIAELAAKMLQAYAASTPEILHADEWHVPYVKTAVLESGRKYFDEIGREISVAKAKIISASCCAQVSYRRNDPSLEKAEKIFARLIESKPVHASPVEHQATPILREKLRLYPQGAVTHVDYEGVPWSANFHGWIQYRQLLEDQCKRY